ncbi:F-box protein [Pyrus ussuriensis x Pyrus communis]|uniref:F-box protein n=1 Tax=Pyrus ussuriensis x Pyrus communis TaxID=2448454 RepID=A0A5N5H9I8_9ROSA|nr:F-box protein [Pyrus ussuriensis x Pyrus communis]
MAHLHLPDLVTQKIIQVLPTKAAVRMNFDEESVGFCRDKHGDKHRKFINNILIRYLRFCENDKQKKLTLLKLRLHMTGYLFREDTNIVDKLLTCSLDRNVKELDISLRRDWHVNENYYGLSRTTFLVAKSLTTLRLAYVKIKDIRSANDGRHIDRISQLLPSLKTMSLKRVRFDERALSSLIWECPCIEYLSLTSCSYEDNQEDELSMFYISSYTLKFLEVKYCKAQDIQVDETINLESFTFVSSKFLHVEWIMLRDSHNLKHINIHAHHLKNLRLLASHRSLEATINTPNLNSIYFLCGYLTSKISLKAPNLGEAAILLLDFWDIQFPTAFNGPWKHLPVLADFLTEFGCSKKFRNTCSSAILPGLNNSLVLKMSNYLETDSDIGELEDSLTWIAPSARDISVEKPLFAAHIKPYPPLLLRTFLLKIVDGELR